MNCTQKHKVLGAHLIYNVHDEPKCTKTIITLKQTGGNIGTGGGRWKRTLKKIQERRNNSREVDGTGI